MLPACTCSCGAGKQCRNMGTCEPLDTSPREMGYFTAYTCSKAVCAITKCTPEPTYRNSVITAGLCLQIGAVSSDFVLKAYQNVKKSPLLRDVAAPDDHNAVYMLTAMHMHVTLSECVRIQNHGWEIQADGCPAMYSASSTNHHAHTSV